MAFTGSSRWWGTAVLSHIQSMGRSLARPARVQSHARSAWISPRDSNLTDRLPGLAGVIVNIFHVCLRGITSPPRGVEAAMCFITRSQRLLWKYGYFGKLLVFHH